MLLEEHTNGCQWPEGRRLTEHPLWEVQKAITFADCKELQCPHRSHGSEWRAPSHLEEEQDHRRTGCTLDLLQPAIPRNVTSFQH